MSVLGKIHKHLFVEAANRFLSSIAFSAMVAPALRLFGASIGKKAHIYSPLILNNTKFTNLSVGDNCHIGRGVLLDLADRIEIGDNVTISMNATIVTHVDFGRSPMANSGRAAGAVGSPWRRARSCFAMCRPARLSPACRPEPFES